MTAHELLIRALVEVAATGQRPPCGDYAGDSPWLSDDHRQRVQAAALCATCPAITACDDAANETAEKFGVWGGTDRTPRPKGRTA